MSSETWCDRYIQMSTLKDIFVNDNSQKEGKPFSTSDSIALRKFTRLFKILILFLVGLTSNDHAIESFSVMSNQKPKNFFLRIFTPLFITALFWLLIQIQNFAYADRNGQCDDRCKRTKCSSRSKALLSSRNVLTVWSNLQRRSRYVLGCSANRMKMCHCK